MKKKIILFVAALLMAITAHAQFEEGKFYAGASLTGLNMSYSGADNLNLGVQGKLGYFFTDDLMLLGLIDFQMNSNALTPNRFMTGVGARYYIEQNGIFLGANTKFLHIKYYYDFMTGVEVGYAFFVSGTVTIEPAIYYDQSFKDHSQYSTIGLKVGIGVYL